MQRATIYKTFLLLALILTTGTYNKCSAAAFSDRRITKKEVYASIKHFDNKVAARMLKKCTQWQNVYREQEAQRAYSSAFIDQTKELMCQLAQQEHPYFFDAIRRLPQQWITLINGSRLIIPPKRMISLDCMTMVIQQMQSRYIVNFLPCINACIEAVIQKEFEYTHAVSSKL